jgi:hypothetical protein
MRPNYTIEKSDFYENPLFISVYNWSGLNLIGLYNCSTIQEKQDNSIGQWRIKYKK